MICAWALRGMEFCHMRTNGTATMLGLQGMGGWVKETQKDEEEKPGNRHTKQYAGTLQESSSEHFKRCILDPAFRYRDSRDLRQFG